MQTHQLIREVRRHVERCQAPELERVAARAFRGHVERLEIRRRERLGRLAEKWGARLVVSGRVVREGGLR